MATKYLPKEFEEKWDKQWRKEEIYKAGANKKSKMYVLDMFPYPSGAGLHVGHPRGYTASDILSRFYRMNGYSVLHPMGWDAFGLPAENAAIKAKKNPLDMVPQNIANFKRQMEMLGFSYDWSREFATTDPEYYKWTQWLFIRFFKMGLLYKKNAPINFCPSCKTGCSDEEVLSNGTHERCGTKIIKKDLPQWLFKITDYAEKLLDGLKDLQWPRGIIDMQRNWIGRSEGMLIEFEVAGVKSKIEVFTTKPETIDGATFLVLAPEHIFLKNVSVEEVKEYIDQAKKKTEGQRQVEEKNKTGVPTGFYAINPLTRKKIPIWVADYVLASYGTGAIMAVPYGDERDKDFAKKFNLPIIKTSYKAKPQGKKQVNYHLRDWIFSRQRYWGEPIPMVFCRACADKKISYWDVGPTSLTTKVGASLGASPEAGEVAREISDRIKEVQKDVYGWFPLVEQELPLTLPYLKSYEPTDTGESPLIKVKDWVKTTCPNCGGEAQRETDTMPNWAGSSWYFIRFAQNQNSNIKNQKEKHPSKEQWINKIMSQSWLPVDWYLGGAEHAVLHLLYSRFWVKALKDIGLLNFSEPFLRLRNVGMVLAEGHRKMSKSLGNVVNPDDIVEEFGADSVRMYEMFMAPFSQEIAWSTQTLQGVYRFLKRVWNIYRIYRKTRKKSEEIGRNRQSENSDTSEFDKKLLSKLQKTIFKVTKDIREIKFNTAIAAMMEFLNEWESNVGVGSSNPNMRGAKTRLAEALAKRARLDSTIESKRAAPLQVNDAKKFLQILAPFAPFTTEEIWRNIFGEKESIHLSSWPKANEKEIVEESIEIPVQVDGKFRATIRMKNEELRMKNIVEEKALAVVNVRKHLAGKKFKTIYVPGKILNFVLM